MTSALDLLMDSDSTAETTTLLESNGICTIDSRTRTIFVPPEIIVGAVQSDKNAERIKFSCPKIVGDNLDLSKFSIRINFENVSIVDPDISIKDQYICEDASINGDNITFSWVIGKNAARYMGTIRFIVCAVKTDSDSNISIEWNTTVAQIPVLEGIEVDQPSLDENNKDVINQLLAITKTASDEAVKNVNSAKEQAITDIQNVLQPDKTLTVEGGIADAKATGNAISSLREDLSDWSRLEGYELANLMPKLKLVKENKYASLDEIGKPPYYGAYDGCNVYSLDIESDVYTFTEARMILPIDEKGNVLAEHINYATSFDNTKLSASKIYLSITDAKESIKSFSISKGTQLRKFDKFPEHTGIPKLENDVKKLENDVITENMPLNMHSVKKIGKFEKNGDSILLSDARTNLRKGIRLIFEANIVNGADFEIGFSISESSADTLPHNRFVVNSTTIEYYESIGQTECSNSFTHKLSISKNVQVIFEYLANGTVDICLLSNGEVFKKNIIFTMNSVAVPYVKSNGLVAKDCKFTFICTDIRKKIWCFGDSYFAYSTARWTYYLREHGYDNNVLLDGFPGMGSTNARSSFSKLLKLGKPKIAVWFEGMNDGADTTDSEPNDDWKSNKDIFIALCEENSVEPVFATIPNVPNINHKGKNKWVKESGYRYIDMCHAVGADVDVNWYGNMLSNDKIHPSENGARALFVQVLLDLPEVMIDNL